MTSLKRAAVLISLLACCAAQAAEPLEVGVAGRIAASNSCTASLSSGVLDYGAIQASELNPDGPTLLPEKPFIVTVDCQAPVNRLIVSFIDHKAEDAIRDIDVLHHPACTIPGCGMAALGLGTDQQDRKIGSLFLLDRGAEKDKQLADWWAADEPKITPHRGASRYMFLPRSAAGMGTAHSPIALECLKEADEAGAGFAHCFHGKHFTIPVGLAPMIDSKAREISGDIRLDGAFTVEIRTL